MYTEMCFACPWNGGLDQALIGEYLRVPGSPGYKSAHCGNPQAGDDKLLRVRWKRRPHHFWCGLRLFIYGLRLGFNMPPIGEPLAGDALERGVCAFGIGHGALVVSEIELGQIALQVMAGNMVIGSDQAALHDREVAFYPVGRHDTTSVFALAVVDLGVLHKGLLALHEVISRAGIGHDVGIRRDMRLERFLEIRAGHIGYMERAQFALAFDKGNDLVHLFHGFPATSTLLGAVGLAPEVGFISLNDLAATAKQARRILPHGFPDTVSHEPSSLISHSEDTVELVGTHTLFGRTKKIDRLQPDIERDLGTLKDRADRDGKRLAAVTALVEARTG